MNELMADFTDVQVCKTQFCPLHSSYEVTRKDRLFKNIQRMQQLKVTFSLSLIYSTVYIVFTRATLC